MQKFKSLSQFARHLQKIADTYPTKKIEAVNALGIYIQAKMQGVIFEGRLQEGAGPFVEWQELAESTKSDKERLGYVFTDDYNPLFRTGELMHSIKYSYSNIGSMTKISWGSESDIMLWQELGTWKDSKVHIPPRSVLGMTLFKETHAITKYFLGFLLNIITAKPIPKLERVIRI